MERKFQYIFWTDEFRELTSDPEARNCGDRKGAILFLYDKMAASASNIVYLNEIYENAQVELKDDNMKEITVMDKFDIRDLYAQQTETDGVECAKLTLDSGNGDPIGIIYAKKTLTGPEVDFQNELNHLNATLAKKAFARSEYLKSMMDKVNNGKIVSLDKARRSHDRG